MNKVIIIPKSDGGVIVCSPQEGGRRLRKRGTKVLKDRKGRAVTDDNGDVIEADVLTPETDAEFMARYKARCEAEFDAVGKAVMIDADKVPQDKAQRADWTLDGERVVADMAKKEARAAQ